MKAGIGLVSVLALMTVACNKQQYSIPEQSQNFGQTVTYNNKVDVIMMIDNSSSMDIYQRKLADQIPGMINTLNKLGMDYRIVVATSDMRTGGNGGHFIGDPRILHKKTPNLANLLKPRINIGNGGSDLERGMESLRTVLSPSYLSGEGAGFLRDDALLAMLILSNEDDYSSGSAQNFADFLDQVKPPFKGFTRGWVLNFIGVPDLSSSCSTALDGIYKEPGLRWIELAEMSQGRVEPICDSSLAVAVDNVRKRIVEILTDFKLGRKPDIATIKVYINGVLIPQNSTNGWEYIEDGYIIRFHGSAVPDADDRIRVDFTPAEAG